ncbi:MAG: VapC toxin family PIN domain ribonuclease [Verrucomicrobia bacterium]|nr:MAG: VapC toxin family PIN domain ribonuclease [Verrucomicrobiota bacterium]
MNLVDSSAWLAYLAEEKNAAFFSEAIEAIELLIVPTICLYEVFKVVLREYGEKMALKIAAAMQEGKVIDLTGELALEAAAVSHEEKLPFADSIIYTIAKQNEAVIWTQDDHFAGKPNVQFRPKPKKL